LRISGKTAGLRSSPPGYTPRRLGRNAVMIETRRARVWFTVAAALVLAGSIDAQKAVPAADSAWPQTAVADPTKIGFSKAGLDALDARMKQAVTDGDTAGATIIPIRHGQVADFRSFGRQSPQKAMANDSLFRIYSMSKPITGVAMMQLYEQGKWKLDDPITKYAPELAGLKALTWDKDGKPVVGADGKPVLTAP